MRKKRKKEKKKHKEDDDDKESKIYYYSKNHLGSIVAITDKKAKVIEKYTYDVFGKAYISHGKKGEYKEFKKSKVGNTRLYTGREYDREIGLYYLRARYYNADTGRFISRDPIDINDNVNLYGYVGNGVVMFVDLSGTSKDILSWNNYIFFILDDILGDIMKVGIDNTIVVKMHYIEYRNKKLIKFESIKQLDTSIYLLQNQDYNKFHTYGDGNKNNVKYLSIDGNQEAIYNISKKEFDYTDINGATYNYGTNIITHTLFDVVPYYILGNSADDSTNIFERILQTFK